MRKVLGAGAIGAAFLSSSVVTAQESNKADSPNDDVPRLEEILVTAQRKEETVQRAGIAVDVVTGDALLSSGVVNTEGLSGKVPALAVQAAGGPFSVFFVRGVGNFTVNGYSDPAIAFNYDGAYIGRPTSTSGVFYDLERVEVLKGPQGTLYGRNATAGAINVIPAKPKLGTFSGMGALSYGNYSALNAQGALNMPMGESAALRVAANVVSRDGYLSDGTSDEKNQAARAQFLVEPADDISLRFAADYSHTGGRGVGSSYAGKYLFSFPTGQYNFVPSGFDASSGITDAASQAYRQTLFAGLSGRTLNPLDPDLYQDNTFYGANIDFAWQTDAGTLTVIPAWRQAKLDTKFGVPAFIGFIQEDDDQLSLEARFNSTRIGAFDYIVGAYYFDETVKGNYTFAQQALNAYQEFESKTTSYAPFAKLTAHLGDRVRLIGGVRYTNDKKDFNGQADVMLVRCTVTVAGVPSCPTTPLLPVGDSIDELQPPFIVPPPGQVRPIGATGAILIRATTVVDAVLEKSKVTYRGAIEFDVASNSLAYVSYETGYRSGGFALSAGYETFQPEYIDAFTLGMKNRLVDDRLQINAEAFLWKYRNQQVNHTGLDINGNQGQFTENVGRSTNRGIEVELKALLTANTLVDLSAQFLDTKYDDFVYSEPVGALPPLSACPFAINANNPALYNIDCSGKPAYQSPKWTVNAGIEQTIPLGEHKLVLAADTQYKTRRSVAFQYLDYQFADANWVSNAQLSFAQADDRWSLTAFMRNIEGDRYTTSAQLYNAVSAALLTTAAPRTYGLRAQVKF